MSSTFLTLADVQEGGEVNLQDPIDNREGNLCVALRSLTYTVGWYNLETASWFSWTPDGGGTGVLNIQPGLYPAQELIDLLLATEAGEVYGMEMSISTRTGLFTVTVNDMEISASDSIWTLLGLDIGLGGTWFGETHTGDRPVNFSGVDRIRVHLNQLNSHMNSLNGAPSSLLEVITPGRQRFGDFAEVFRSKPQWKKLQDGVVSTIQLQFLDSSGRVINNNGYRFMVMLEIRPAQAYRYVEPRTIPC